jgi:hypothetical protein
LRGRVGEGALCNRCRYHFQNALTIPQNVKIVKTKNTKGFLLQIMIAPTIASRSSGLEMLAAVDLDDQALSVRNEVHDVRTNRRLTTEAGTTEPMSA